MMSTVSLDLKNISFRIPSNLEEVFYVEIRSRSNLLFVF